MTRPLKKQILLFDGGSVAGLIAHFRDTEGKSLRPIRECDAKSLAEPLDGTPAILGPGGRRRIN